VNGCANGTDFRGLFNVLEKTRNIKEIYLLLPDSEVLGKGKKLYFYFVK